MGSGPQWTRESGREEGENEEKEISGAPRGEGGGGTTRIRGEGSKEGDRKLRRGKLCEKEAMDRRQSKPNTGLPIPAEKEGEDIKVRTDSFPGREPPSYITMLKFKFFAVALFAAVVHASAIGQFSPPPPSCSTTN